MKTKWITMFIAVSLIFSSCNEKGENQTKNKNNTDTTVISDNQPTEDIKVYKEYDKNGNLIRFDSTYSYYYSNIDGNKAKGDSIFNKFRRMFENRYPFSRKSYFDNLFFNDSSLHYNFYKKDFFLERFRQNRQQLDKLFSEMDSIKNKFFLEQFPEEKKNKI
jgi:hypothetical protein